MAGHCKWKCLICVWNALKWKSVMLLWLPLESIQTGTWFWPDWVGEQAEIEWIDPDNDAVALVTNWEPLVPRTNATSPWTLNSTPSPMFQTVGVLFSAGPSTSCSAPITKLSAQIKEAGHLTAAKHTLCVRVVHLTPSSHIPPDICTCISPDWSSL